jgi:uncharacterized protein (DUF983 family)
MLGIMTLLFRRALFLRCPRCGKGKLFRRGFAMYDRCPYCGWQYEREEGYWTGAIAINLVVTELLIAVIFVPLAALQFPMIPLILAGVPLAVGMPILFYRHSKAFWMAIELILNPVSIWW